ncbi:hypothetical protein L596_027950 [Steinernema carpocapsae]|uniref:Domain of unknown function DB domain-containing protein n=1 Tax=Steinernema carpocapsae TaxID=34508 RepID=A0A4U5LX06_STECR|nr:hypothetical protein L596_027950 [Steinernema carpocapsae]
MNFFVPGCGKMKIFLFAFWLAVPLLGNAAKIVDTLSVAKKCCGEKAAECCKESFDFKNPLKCPSMAVEDKVLAISCAQKELYGAEDFAKLSVHDFKCCEIFGENDNDESGICEKRCLVALQAPSVSAKEKLERIHGCRMNVGSLPKCFDKCLEWIHSPVHRMFQQFNFTEHCNWTDRLKPGKLYIGPPV